MYLEGHAFTRATDRSNRNAALSVELEAISAAGPRHSAGSSSSIAPYGSLESDAYPHSRKLTLEQPHRIVLILPLSEIDLLSIISRRGYS